MRVRPATTEDGSAIIRLLDELHEQSVPTSAIEASLLLLINDPRRDILLIEDEEGPHGMVVINLVYKLPKIEARIDEVVVDRASRGKGYGRILVEAAETWAWNHDADVIEFTSRPSREAASALYQKMGYTLRQTNVYQKKRGS